MNTLRRVVVTGCGTVTPLGSTVAETWNGIRDQRIGYTYLEQPDSRIKSRFFGRVPTSPTRKPFYPRSLHRQLPQFARFAMEAAGEAMNQAFPGVSWRTSYSPFQAGVILATGWGGLDSANHNNNEYKATGVPATFATIQSMNHVGTAAIAMHWGMRGPQLTPAAACAAGAVAVGEGSEMIRSGRADLVIVGGSESLCETFNVVSIDVIGALSKEQSDVTRACCPFDRRRSGFVLSEGAAVLVLEEREAALRRGARILGEITGYGNTTDAHDFTAPAPDRAARVKAIELALGQASASPDEIDYVNAHGTSTPLNDLDESESIKMALGALARQVPISSTKSYTGHLIGAAGALETIICLLALQDGFIPATINLREPDPDCDLDYVPNRHRSAKLKRVLNLSFGFGGANAALVIEGVQA